MSAPTTYSELQAKVVDLLKRTGDSQIEALAPDWIAYAESEMQMKIKLLEFESSASVTVTSGTGSLPSGYVGMRSVYWDDDSDRPLLYINTDSFDALRDDSGDPVFYTTTGASIKVSPSDTGTAVLTYLARFTPLSGSNTSNAILTTYPDAYLYGALKHGCVWVEDDAGMQKYGLLFNAACDRINVNNEQRKYGHSLAVRVR
jgi:hypothetical protein